MSLTTADGLRLDAHWQEATPSRAPALGTVTMVHGLDADLAEFGNFTTLADRLVRAGFSVLRFSFRGHGKSDGSPRDVTIAGERRDLVAATELAAATAPERPLWIIAASFGAVSTLSSLRALPIRPRGIVLWNPVLDLRRTFSPADLDWLRARHGDTLLSEFARHDPGRAFRAASDISALVVHGGADTRVPYAIARDASLSRPNTVFSTIRGGEHGFLRPAESETVVRLTARWLARQAGSQSRV